MIRNEMYCDLRRRTSLRLQQAPSGRREPRSRVARSFSPKFDGLRRGEWYGHLPGRGHHQRPDEQFV
jgi:hypothetical protein